jgi:tellurite resistance protein TehA-like permease
MPAQRARPGCTPHRAVMGARAAWQPPPGAFSAVMATGALSVASRARLSILSAALLWLGVVELGAIVLAIALARRRGALDALTLAAASGVLAVRFALGGDRAVGAGFALVAAAAFGYAAGLIALCASRRCGSRREASGAWLLAVVATQSIAVCIATVAPTGWSPYPAAAGEVVWTIGIVAYLILIPIVGGRMLETAALRGFRPDSWIQMGALAISAVAAGALLRTPAPPLASELRGGCLATWVIACCWVPVLMALDLRTAGRRTWWASEARWAMAFPIAMLSIATQTSGRVAAVPAVVDAGETIAWLALATWALVAAGVLHSAGRGLDRGEERV